MVYYVIKIDNREYQVRDTPQGLEIGTEIGWLCQGRFINYLLNKEKLNSILDLASIGLDRLLKLNNKT